MLWRSGSKIRPRDERCSYQMSARLKNKEIIDQKPMYYLYYDVLNLFMLSVAGFNMGAAASLPPKVIKLLVQTDFTELKNSELFKRN